jgi:hypothetical protein
MVAVRARWRYAVLAAALVLTACGGDSAPSTTPDSAARPDVATTTTTETTGTSDVTTTTAPPEPFAPECAPEALLAAYDRTTLDVPDVRVEIVDFACTPISFSDAADGLAYAMVEAVEPVEGEPVFEVTFHAERLESPDGSVSFGDWEVDGYGSAMIEDLRALCAAGGVGAPCDDLDDGPSDVLSLEAGLLCRDLAAQGYEYDDAVAYWNREGQPGRMDIDLDGIPCETMYPDAAAVLEVDPGGKPTFSEGVIVRGDPAQVYVVSVDVCCTGETLNIKVGALEDNASFYLYAPDGSTLVEDQPEASIELTETGKYRIEVGATRGNATYTIEVGIAVPAG